MEIERGFIFDPGLVLYLPLYELDGASFMSKDKHGHLCTVTGALWTPLGRSFDGTDDEITTGLNPSTTLGQEVTILSWLYPTAQNNYRGVWGWMGATADGGIYLQYSTNDWRVGYSDGTAFQEVLAGTMTLNEWTHFAGVIKGSAYIKAYKNLVEYSATKTTAVVHHTQFRIGRAYSTTDRFFKGKEGEVLVFKRVLTPLEIQQHYLATKWRYR